MNGESIRARWVAATLALVGASACASEVGDGAPEDGSLLHESADLGANTVVKEWDSAKDDNLSGWKDLSCYANYGHQYQVTGLKAYSDAGSLDAYIARLEGECSEYTAPTGIFTQNGKHETATLFTSDHQDDGEWTKVGADEYAAGVVVGADPWDDYVQTLRFETVSEPKAGEGLGSYKNPELTPAVGPMGITPIIGPLHYLECPDQDVMSSFSVRYDTKKGKIRQVKITCRSIDG